MIHQVHFISRKCPNAFANLCTSQILQILLPHHNNIKLWSYVQVSQHRCHWFHSTGRDGNCKHYRNETVCPNLACLMQQMHARPRERGDNRAFISVNDGDDSKRVFPFQATPSGNLKIVPNQVNVPLVRRTDGKSSSIGDIGLRTDA